MGSAAVSTVASQQHQAGVFLWSLLSVCLRGFYSGFLPQSKLMQSVGLVGDTKLPTGVNGCVCLCFSPVTNWQPVRVYPASLPMTTGIGSTPRDPEENG